MPVIESRLRTTDEPSQSQRARSLLRHVRQAASLTDIAHCVRPACAGGPSCW